MIKSISSTIIAMILWTEAVAQTAQLTLNDILDSVRLGNPTMKMFSNEVKSMEEAAKGAKSWMAPEISTGLWMVPYNPMMWSKSDAGLLGMGQYMVGISQMIPNAKKLQADANYMWQMSFVEVEKQNAVLNELLNDAKSNYYEWLVINKKLNILKQQEELLTFMIQTAELRYTNGLDKISAYYKAKAALGDLQSMRLMYENELTIKRFNLNALMGRQAEISFTIDTAFTLNDYTGYKFDSSFFNQNRSDLHALDAQNKLAELKIETERQALKPQFGVRFDHMIGFGGLPPQFTAMAMMRIPMAPWSSKMNVANIESLKLKSAAIQSEKQMLVNEYSAMAYAMRNEFELKKKQIKIYNETILPSLENNYKTMQLGYEQNTEELFMLFDAWETLYMTRIANLDLLKDALVLQVSIDRMIESTL